MLHAVSNSLVSGDYNYRNQEKTDVLNGLGVPYFRIYVQALTTCGCLGLLFEFGVGFWSEIA